ncbi:MAG TPA: PilZ domain-containing protein [Thermoanaerobaculia bacterium]
MNDEVTDLRKGDRFIVVELIEGTFNSVPVSLVNLSLGGAQIQHAHPVRLGTPATLSFVRGGVGATVTVTVVWSHLQQTEEGLRYKSGVKLQEPDVRYAAAMNSFIRSGAIAIDTESLERKRQREAEKQMRRQSPPKITALPTS